MPARRAKVCRVSPRIGNIAGHNVAATMCPRFAGALGLFIFDLLWNLRSRQNENTLWRHHCNLRFARPWQNEATLLRASRTQEMFLDIFRNILCPPLMLRAWQNESAFWKHDHVSNVAATMCPRFGGPYQDNRKSAPVLFHPSFSPRPLPLRRRLRSPQLPARPTICPWVSEDVFHPVTPSLPLSVFT